MSGEDEYYFTTIESALEFILNLDKSYKNDLKLNEVDLARFEIRLQGGKNAGRQAQSLDELLTQSFEESKAQKDFLNDTSLFTDTDELQTHQTTQKTKILPGFEDAFSFPE